MLDRALSSVQYNGNVLVLLYFTTHCFFRYKPLSYKVIDFLFENFIIKGTLMQFENLPVSSSSYQNNMLKISH